MGRFLIEGFAGATGENLAARQPVLGGPWAKVNGAAPDIVLSILNRARGNSNTLARYVAAGVPETADYDVSGRTIQQSAVGGWWVTLRSSSAADTCYAVGYTAGSWQIVRRVNGASATLASVAGAWAANETKAWRVKIRGTNPVTVELRDALVNGNVLLSASDVAANRITAAGLAGLHINGGTNTLFENRGYHVGLLTGFALPTDPRPRTPKPAPGPLAARILAKTDPERAAERAAILNEAGTPAGWQVTRGPTTYSLSLPQRVAITSGRLVVPAVACSPAPPTPLDPTGYVFVNPPVKVPDGTVHEDVDDQGEPILAANFVENPLEAIRQIVADCVLRGA